MTEMIENKTFDEIRLANPALLVLAAAFCRHDVETWVVVTGNLNIIDLYLLPPISRRPRRPLGRRCGGAPSAPTIADTRLPGIGSVNAHGRRHPISPAGADVRRAAHGDGHRSRKAGGCIADHRPRLRLHRRQRPEAAVGVLQVAAPRHPSRHPLLASAEGAAPSRGPPPRPDPHAGDGMPPLRTAVVHPCSDDALKGAIEAAERNLITPYLIALEKKIPGGRRRKSKVDTSPLIASSRPSIATTPPSSRCRWCTPERRRR